jgi:Zn-dependent protease with chaperone function
LVGIPLLAVGVFIAPRRRRLDPRGTVLLTPGSAPNLYALVNRVSQSIGGQSAQIIAVNGAFNASHELFGWRRRRVLRIGLPLWNILTDEERLALLAHEMAHQVNGDIAHSLVLSTALRTLFGWKRAFIPTPTRRRPGIGEMGGQLLTALLGATVDLLIELELWLMYANKQRAEYFADSLATRVASTDATVAMLGRLMLGFTARTASSRTETGESSSFWELQREALRRTPAKEIERIRRVDERRGTAIDSTHPPTSLRIKMLRQHPPHPATITISTVESSAIEQELAPAYNEIDQLMKGLVIRG